MEIVEGRQRKNTGFSDEHKKWRDKRMFRKGLVFSLTLVMIFSMVFLGVSCINDNGNNDDNGNNFNGNNNGNGNDQIVGPNGSELPKEIEEWVNNSLDMNLGQSRAYGENLYILVTYGEKPTGGYDVDITDVRVTDEKVEVSVYFKAPQEGDVVTQAITYPYDIEVIDKVDLPVVFDVSGDEDYLMTLQGIDELKPIVAESNWIKIFEPAPNSTMGDQVSISGIASVFEGNIVYEVIDENGNTLYESFTTAGMGDWYYFEVEIELPEETTDSFKVELYSPSAIDGSKTSLVSLTLKR